jgi:2-polyprenyl-6-methoxyphenol hydroxylase-like FAD-dependent oxidoreductase
LGDFDALIAGAGPAGCAAAAALSALGLRVLLLDAGADPKKQLAGELIHPSGVEDLIRLGFGNALESTGAQPVRGFAVIDTFPRDQASILPYREGQGIALEHALLRKALLDGLAGRAGIAIEHGSRLTQVQSNGPKGAVVAIRREEGGEQRISVRLLIAADGRASHLRKLLGIGESRERLSSMLGVLVGADKLPQPGHGHLFIGGAAPVLGYAITPAMARIMVDLPAGNGAAELLKAPELLAGLPVELRRAVIEASGEGQVLIAANETRLPDAVAIQSAVLIGDAAGCCHPLSASGLASCTRDARVLQEAVRRLPDDLPAAAQWYAAKRRAPQRTRIALASALYRTFSEPTAEMAALRVGLFRYWRQSRSGRSVSMALLSTREARISIMALEYARAVFHALLALFSADSSRRRGGSVRIALRLIRSAFPHFRAAIAGALEDLRSAGHRLLTRPARWRRVHERAAAEPEPSRAPLSRM